MDSDDALPLARMAVGAGAWVAPRLGLMAAMLDATAPQSAYLLRLICVRDVALGAVTLMADAQDKPALLKLGIIVDAGDMAASLMAMRGGAVKPSTGVALACVAASSVLAGCVAVGQRRRL